MVMMGPDCSSWGVPARGTSLRSPINCYGNLFLDWVRRSNCMVSRTLGLIGWAACLLTICSEGGLALLAHLSKELRVGCGATAGVNPSHLQAV